MAAALLTGCGAGSGGPGAGTGSLTTPTTPTAPTTHTTPPTTSGSATTPTTTPAGTSTPATTTLPTGWTEQRLLAQLVMVGADFSDAGTAAPSLAAGAGGVVFVGQPAAGTGPVLSAAMSALVREAEVLPFMATDEEGGGVARLANLTSPTLPWPRQVVEGGWTTAQLESTVARIAAEMRALGMNMDLAPVLDTAAPDDPVDYESKRSFSASGEVAAAYGKAFLDGLSAGGMIGAVKHFPGLGQASADTDLGAAADPPLSRMANDLVPFRQAIAGGVRVVMMSNVTEPDWGPAPATLDPAAYRYLRSLGFDGVIITDSLGAGAVTAYGMSAAAAAVRAIESGADMAMLASPTQFAATMSGLEQAVATGRLSMGQVIRSVDRIVAVKNLLLPAGAQIAVPR